MYKKHMVVPAEPNWYALDWCLTQNDTGVNITREPIIAWSVTLLEERGKVSTELQPVTQDELSALYEGAILRPDGTVAIRSLEFFQTLTEYTQDVRKRHINNATTIMDKAEALNNAAQ